MRADFGEQPLDILVHSLANGPEVKKPLLEVSRAGYLSAVSVSAYSLIGMLRAFGPMLRPNASVASLTYMASERAIPGYGGGMSSAKAALESDTRVLAYEAGRKYGARVNTVSAGPYASRAASAIGIIGAMVTYCEANSALPQALDASEVGHATAFLCSPARERDHGGDGVRGQGIPRDGDGGGWGVGAWTARGEMGGGR